ncbi:MAG TPA: sulfurtransferase [Acidimicrobiales bacterium]|nr:sulfurtransferase [Acidimicrobiales bacterium]
MSVAASPDPPAQPPWPPVVAPEWLREHYDEVVVADVRWYLDGRSGYDAYLERHLPGAVFVDLDRCLAGPAAVEEGRHPLPAPDNFARAMTSVGITGGQAVVGYDDDGGRIAARLVWLLRVSGHRASLLDGGIDAWPGPVEGGPVEGGPLEGGPVEGGPLERGPVERGPIERGPVERPSSGRGPVSPAAGALNLREWPAARFVPPEEVTSASIVLDARAPERYRGEVEPVDARAGHIPGARNAPTAGNLDERGRFKTPEALRDIYGNLGVDRGSSPVVYCGSGVTACHDLIALELAGFEDGRLYPGSWSQWSADPARPVETGAEGGR